MVKESAISVITACAESLKAEFSLYSEKFVE